MGYLIFMVFLAVVGVIFWFFSRWAAKHDFFPFAKPFAAWIVLGALAGIGIITTAVNVAHQVPAGYVGVVYEFGAIKGQISEGLQFVPPWRNVTLANIQVQSHQPDKLSAFSSESQDVYVFVTLNIRISPTAVQDLFRRVGPNYYEVLVAPRLAQNFKDETVKYKSVDIAPNREQIRHAVSDRLARELSSYSIEVVDLLLNNVDFNLDFKEAVEKKQIATQNALEEEQRVQVAKYKAAQGIETAKGEGQAELEKAIKVAEANKKMAASITPALIQYNLTNKLGSQIQVMVLPSGQNFILGPEMLKKRARPQAPAEEPAEEPVKEPVKK